MKYIVHKIIQYTEEVIVEADSEKEAKDIAMQEYGEVFHDDSVYDCVIVGTVKED